MSSFRKEGFNKGNATFEIYIDKYFAERLLLEPITNKVGSFTANGTNTVWDIS